jgi:signal transduction histidine kinase
MFGSRNHSITRKLTRMNMLVSGAALLIACVAFIAYDLASFRQAMLYDLSMQAQIIGSNSVSALLFNDPDSAAKTLSALRAAPEIVSAGIDTPDGQPFAAYRRDSGGIAPALPPISSGLIETSLFQGKHILLVRSIVSQGKPAGIVYIQSDLQRLQARLKRFIVIACTVLAASLLAALLVSSMFQKSTAQPIMHLAKVARIVSQEKNYSIRATPSGNRDEVGELLSAFNEMLSQIQERDAALQKAHLELEQRVQERTVQLASVNKELEAFSYSVSHDLRAPLRHINGFSSILMENYSSKFEPDAQQYLKRIKDAATNMDHLVNDLLNLARIGRQELDLKPARLDSLLQKVLEELQPECDGRLIEWRIGSLPSMDCDAGLIKSVFANLLSNAVKYTRRKELAVIEVGHTTQNSVPVIFVRDNGAGFNRRYADKLFGAFQRLHGADEFEGTGVGLATVQRIVHKHGGDIWAESEVDKGATFFFTLTAAAPAVGLMEPAEPVEMTAALR